MVKGRILPKSHGSGKTFPGPRALRSMDTVCYPHLMADQYFATASPIKNDIIFLLFFINDLII